MYGIDFLDLNSRFRISLTCTFRFLGFNPAFQHTEITLNLEPAALWVLWLLVTDSIRMPFIFL